MPSQDKGLAHPQVKWLKEEMERQEVNAGELARRTKVDQAAIWKILNGRTRPQSDTLQRLAKGLGRELPRLQLVPAETLPERHKTTPRMPQVERSPATPVLVNGADATSGGPVLNPPSSDALQEDGDTFAQLLVTHWQRIAQAHELTGMALLELLEQEATWFREHRYLEAYDATINLIRQIRFIDNGRRKPKGLER